MPATASRPNKPDCLVFQAIEHRRLGLVNQDIGAGNARTTGYIILPVGSQADAQTVRLLLQRPAITPCLLYTSPSPRD